MGLDPVSWGLIISAAIAAAGAGVSYSQGQEASKQAKYNSQAAADAIAAEQQRKNAVLAENQRRQATQSRRERAAQLADMVGTGFVTTTGTPLALMADTIEAQSRRTADMTSDANLENWQLGTQGQSILAEGRSQASLIRGQAGASLISGLAGAASSGTSAYMNRPKTATR